MNLPPLLKALCFPRHTKFLSRLTAAILTTFILGCPLEPAGGAEYRAFWADAWNAGFMNQSQVDAMLGVPGTTTAGRIRDANCNTVIVQVRRRYDVCYPTSLGEKYMTGLSPTNFNALQAILDAAHDTTGGKKRIDVHCWLVTFATAGNNATSSVYFAHNTVPTGSLTAFDNYWPTRDDKGAETADKAFDPGHPLMLQYIVNACMELVNNFDIDGIHYDYIRFTANNQGYNPTSIARYNARYSTNSQPRPDDPRFMQWRRDQVSAVVRQVYTRIQQNKPWVKQSGSFVTWNPSPTASTRAAFEATRPYGAIYTDNGVYSDWDSWIQEGIVDIAVPMTYYDWAVRPTDYTKWMNFEKDRKGNRHMIIGPGTYMNYLSDAIYELNLTRSNSPAGNRADGFSAYSYANPYTVTKGAQNPYGTWDGFAPSLKANVTPTWDDIPTMPWKTSPTTGHIMGTVTNGLTGMWADGAMVSVTGPTNRSMYVDANGFYAFIDLPPGSYTVTASKPGLPSSSATADVAVGVVTGNMYQLDFTLETTLEPTIIIQPQSQTVGQGTNATFTVIANGNPQLYYQWRFYGTNLPGATASSCTRTNAQPADEGPYSVLITNTLGSVTSSNATLTVIQPPLVTVQPQSQTVTQGVAVTFSVSLSGTAPFSYEWKFNGQPISGATDSSYTRSNVQAPDEGSYSVVVSNFAGTVTSSNAVLVVNTPPTPPGITTQPQSLQLSPGSHATFSVSASGSTPLAYQWRFSGTNLPGATASSLALSSVTTNQSGPYSVVVTNAYGAITSQVVLLTVNPPLQPVGMSQLWSLAPGARSYLATNSLPNARGMAYNPVTRHLLVASRSGPHVYVLDANTGADLYELNVSGISGGTYDLLMVGVAEDGAVYAGNLRVAGSTDPFKLYRWANDSSGTVPTVAFSGDPSPGNSQRWGDTMDVRGAGANTQVIIASRSSTNVSILTTANGLTFSAKPVSVAGASNGSFGLGVAWGESNTFWGKANAQSLRQVSYNLSAGTGSPVHVYADPTIPSAVSPIGVSTPLNLLGGINIGAGNNHLRLYDLSPVATGGNPILLATSAFATDNDNTGTGTGAVDFSNDRVYALCANNGIIALNLTSLTVGPVITYQPQPQTVNEGEPVTFVAVANGTPTPAYQWRFNGSNISGATDALYTLPNAQSTQAGSYTVVVTNTAGSATSLVATLTVNVAPAIAAHPQSTTANAGAEAFFSVTATGTAPLLYQWRFNEADIPGATLNTYTRSNLHSWDAGSYSVLVSNLAGTATSSPAVLAVNPPAAPHIDEIAVLPEGQIRLQLSGSPGQYGIDGAATLGNWGELTNFVTTASRFEFIDTQTNLPQRFYRARLLW